MAEDLSIKVRVDPDTSDVQNKLNKKNNLKLPVKVDIQGDEAIKSFNKQLATISKGNHTVKVSVNVDGTGVQRQLDTISKKLKFNIQLTDTAGITKMLDKVSDQLDKAASKMQTNLKMKLGAGLKVSASTISSMNQEIGKLGKNIESIGNASEKSKLGTQFEALKKTYDQVLKTGDASLSQFASIQQELSGISTECNNVIQAEQKLAAIQDAAAKSADRKSQKEAEALAKQAKSANELYNAIQKSRNSSIEKYSTVKGSQYDSSTISSLIKNTDSASDGSVFNKLEAAKKAFEQDMNATNFEGYKSAIEAAKEATSQLENEINSANRAIAKDADALQTRIDSLNNRYKSLTDRTNEKISGYNAAQENGYDVLISKTAYQNMTNAFTEATAAKKSFDSSMTQGNLDAYEKALNNLNSTLGVFGTELGSAKASADKAFQSISGRIETLNSKLNTLKQFYRGSGMSDTGIENTISSMETALKSLRNIDSLPDTEMQYKDLVSLFGEMGDVAKSSGVQINSLTDLMKALGVASNDALDKIRTFTSDDQAAKNIDSLQKRLNNLQYTLTRYYESNPKIQNNNDLTAMYDSITSGINQAIDSKDVTTMSSELSKASKSVAEFKTQVQSLNLEGKTLAQTFQDLFGQHFSTMIAMAGIHMIQNSLQQVYQNILDIDTAMTELKKVTDETANTYDQFLSRSSQTAKQLGANISDLVNTTADWARLGYSMEDSEYLAKISTLYKNVGDNIDTASQASEYLISTLQGFDMDASSAGHILDVINAVSNTEPVSAQDLGEIMKRSSAAMSAANNTMEETIALATAMNSVLQDSAKTGTTLKTVSMYLRATKTDLEEAGESTEGMAETTSKLREQLMALTHGKVDIQLDEDTYKSTYQILKEMSAVWDEMTDKERAAALELMGGKRNANAVQAVIQQFQIAEDSLATAENSAGSAMKENEKYLDSIQGKIATFQATFEALSNDMIDSGAIKSVIDLGTGILGLIDNFVNLAGAIPAATTALSMFLSAANINTKGNALNLLNMFGQAKNPNGSSYFTFLGKEAKQSINDIKAAMEVAEEYSGLINKSGFDAKAGVLGSFLLGNNKQDYDFSKSLNKDIEALKELFSGASLESVKKNFDTSDYFDEFTKNIDTAGKSFKELSDTYIPQYISSTTGAVAATTTLQTGLIKLKTVAINAGLALAQSLAITAVVYLVVKAVQVLAEAFDNLIHPEKQMDEEINNLKETTSGYTSEIDKLQEKLDETNDRIDELSNKDVGTIVDKQEIENLKLTNTELENQITLKKQLRKESATNLNNTVAQRASVSQSINIANPNAAGSSGSGTASSYLTGGGSIQSSSYAASQSNNASTNNGTYQSFTGTPIEILNKLMATYDELKVKQREVEDQYSKGIISSYEYEKQNEKLSSAMSKTADQALNQAGKIQDLNDSLDENGDGYEEQSKIFNDAISAYNDWEAKSVQGLTDLQRAYNEYNSMISDGDESTKKLKSAIESGMVDKNADYYQTAIDLANKYNVSVDDLIQTIKDASVANKDYIDSTSELTQSVVSSSQTLVSNIDKVKEALDSQSAATGVSADSYKELVEADSDYAAALETSNGHIRLNRDMVEDLTDAKIDEAKANIELAYSQNQMKYSQVKADMEALDNELENNNNLTDEQKTQYQDARKELEEQSKALRDNCESLKMQYDALVQASSAYQDWLNSQNASEAGDMYSDSIEAKKAIQEGLKNGKIGTIKYKAAVDLLVPEDMKDNVQEYIKTLNRYFQEAEDGSDTASGIENFINDSIKKGLMSKDDSGLVSIVEGKTLEDFSKQLNITKDDAQALFGVLQDYGWTFDWGDILGNTVDNIRMKIDDLQDQLNDLGPGAEGSEEWNIINDKIAELKEELQGLYDPSKSGLDQMASDVEKALDDSGQELNDFQAAMLNDNGRVQVAVDLANAKSELESLESELSGKTELSIVDIKNLTDAQEKVETLEQKKQELGEPTSIEIQAYIKSDSESETTRKIKELTDAGVLKLDTSSADSAVGDVKQTTDEIKNEAGKIVMKIDTSGAQTNITNVKNAIESIPNEKKFTINIVTKGSVGLGFNWFSSKSNSQKSSSNKASASGGESTGGKTLVGELGNEIVVNPRTGKWYTVGDNGAEFVNLPKGAIVFDHEKTQKLLGQGFVGGRGDAYAGGTALASGLPNYSIGGSGYLPSANPATSKTYTKATKDNTKAVEDNKEALEKQKEALEKQKEAYEKESNALKIYGQAAIDEIDKRIEAINKEKEAQQKSFEEQKKQLEDYKKKQTEAYDKQIEALEEKKKALQKANDEEDRAIKLGELEEALARAQSQKTVRIYNENEGFVWRADQESVNDAQDDLDEQKREWKDEDASDAIDEEIEKINEMKDALDESIESQIESLEEREDAIEESFDAEIEKLENLKDEWNDAMSLIGTSWEDYQLQLQAAAEFSGMSFDAMAQSVGGYKDAIIANMQQIGDTDAQINRVTEAISALENAAGGGGGSGSGGGGGGATEEIGGMPSDGGGIAAGADTGSGSGAGMAIDTFVNRLKSAGGVSDETANKLQDLIDQINQTGEAYITASENEAMYRDMASSSILSYEERAEASRNMAEAQKEQQDAQSILTDLSAQYLEALGNETTATDTARQVASDALTELSSKYNISYEEIFTKLDSYVQKMIETGTSTSDQFTSMGTTISIFSTTAIQQLNGMGGAFDGIASKASAMASNVQASCLSALKAIQTLNMYKMPSFPSVGSGNATGVINSNTTRLALTDENGPELRIRSNKGQYSIIEQGTSLIPANPSEVLWKFGMNPDDFIAKHMKQQNIPKIELNIPESNGVTIGDIKIEMNGVNDVQSFGEVLARKAPAIIAQTFSRRK